MGSIKFLRLYLIIISFINIIFFISLPFLHILFYDYNVKNNLIYDIIDLFEMIILVYLLLTFIVADSYLFYKIVLIICIVINVLYLNIMLKKIYNRLIYFLYIIINILLILPIYLLNFNTITDIFTGYNFLLYIIFFLEIVLPIIYLIKTRRSKGQQNNGGGNRR